VKTQPQRHEDTNAVRKPRLLSNSASWCLRVFVLSFPSSMLHQIFCSIVLVSTFLCHSLSAQVPTPTPTPTGRSYDTSNLPKTPPVPGPQAKSPVLFSNITSASNIDFKHAGSPTSKKFLLETMGGGVAIFDFNNDGRMDLFFTNGAALREDMSNDSLPDKTNPGFWNRLYQQQTDGTFQDVTERAGLKGDGYSMGVAAGDFDNDGFVDLYVTGYAKNHLYHNNGDGRFTDVTEKLGLPRLLSSGQFQRVYKSPLSPKSKWRV